MEIEILRTLGWRLNGPTPCDFIHRFLELLPLSADMEAVKILTAKAVKNSEDVMMDYSLAMERPSHIALAAIQASTRTDKTSSLYEKMILLGGWFARI